MKFLRMTRRAAVLGCGPSGLFAAMALEEEGWNVSVLSLKRKSEMFGAQYLHRPIPGLSEGSSKLTYDLWGSVEAYAAKVYQGRVPADKVSPSYIKGEQEVWDIREAYSSAWDIFADRITSTPIGPADIFHITESFDLTVCTIPTPDLCMKKQTHLFHSERVWAVGDAPERGIFCPIRVSPYTVVCNGLDNPRWYRASNVFNFRTAEWPEEKKPPVEDISLIHKPISTTCDCHLGRKFLRAGRFGKWTKGVLSHEAYYDFKGKR